MCLCEESTLISSITNCKALKDYHWIALETSFLYAEQTIFLSTFFICQVLQPSYHGGDPLLDPVQLFSLSLQLCHLNWTQNYSGRLKIIN